jgi:soluble lytic murein transglycosylase-like protein
MGSRGGLGSMNARGQSRALGMALACVCLAVPAAVHAQVIEIGDGGAVTVHDRPEVTTASGSTPIAGPTRRSVPAGRTPTPSTLAALSEAADAARLSPELIEAVAWRESRLRAGVVSTAGAVGEMQLMPGTARTLGVDPYDSRQNLAGGATYLRAMMKRYDGDIVLALAAYNAGPAAVDRYRGVPPYKETQAYVAAVLERLSQRAEDLKR